MTKIQELMPWMRTTGGSPSRNVGSSLAALQEEMNQLFDNFFSGRPSFIPEWTEGMGSVPAINIVENGDSFKVDAVLAGMDPKNVDVEVANGFLTIKGSTETEKKEEGVNYLRHEISCGSCLRTVALPVTADGDKAKASFKNGILTVMIPKKAEAVQKAKKIEVKAAA